MGVPEMEAFWTDITSRQDAKRLDPAESRFFRKLVRALDHLRTDPRHSSLKTHEIDALSKKYGFKIFQSYLENKTPAAGRLFWTYGPGKGEITILGIEPHPESAKRGAYERIKLSKKP